MTPTNLNQQANTREQILFALVMLAMVVLFFRIFYASYTVKIDQVKQKTLALEMEKKALIKFAESTPVLEKTLSLSPKKGIKLKILSGDVIANDQDITSLLTQLTQPLLLGRVVLQKLSYQPPVRDKGYVKTDFTLNILGNFMDIVHYMERMEQFPALFDIQNVNFRSITGQARDLEAEIQGGFFQFEKGGKGS